MPLYLFEHTKTGEIHEVVYHMSETKDYRGPKGKAKVGVWRRVWSKPGASFDTVNIDPFSGADFVKATNKKGTIGELWDRSAELSEKRAQKEGRDPVKECFFDNYSKRRRGVKHPLQRREEANRQLAAKGIDIDWGDN